MPEVPPQAAASPPVPGPVRMTPPSAFAVLRSLLTRGETIRLLTRSQLAAGHRDKLLGNLWSLLDPLLTLAVYYVVFGIGFRQAAGGAREFVLYLFLGIVLWRFFSDSITQATGCLRSQRGLILSADFPKAVIPISICLARLYDLACSLAIVLAAAWWLEVPFSPRLAWLPLIIGLELALTLGLCFLMAYMGLFFADTANIVGALLRLWVLVTPIFYFARSAHGRPGIVPPGLLDYYMLNPMAGILEASREVLIWNGVPRSSELAYVAAFALVTLALGFVVFARGEGRFAKFV